MAGLKVRTCGVDDSASLWELFDQDTFKRLGSLVSPFAGPADVRRWLERNAPGNLQIVGLLENAIVGFAGLYVFDGLQSHIGQITLAVREEWRGRGIGTGLLKLLVLAAAKLVGLKRIQLTVFTDNAGAISLYHAAGFEIEGCHKNFARRGNGFVDAYTMARLIGVPESVRSGRGINARSAGSCHV